MELRSQWTDVPIGAEPKRYASRVLMLASLWCVSVAVPAQGGPAAERQRLANESAAVEARFKAQEVACQQRFAVTDCVNLAKQERRDALAPLRRQSAALDDAQRKQRAAERREAIGQKLEGAQTREREIVLRGAPAAASAPAAPLSGEATEVPAESAATPARPIREAKPPKPPPSPRATRTAATPASAADRRARGAEAQARAAARVQAAQERREAVEKRNAERELRGKRVSPLPVPASGTAR
ncbi:MAG: hypothetical protein AD742_13325 [Methylibium sp. NZG]|nr:MAG: hypothetical protein AD742_13325 [Methylibium sp. NZG]